MLGCRRVANNEDCTLSNCLMKRLLLIIVILCGLFSIALTAPSGVLHKTWKTDLRPGELPINATDTSTSDVMDEQPMPDEMDVFQPETEDMVEEQYDEDPFTPSDEDPASQTRADEGNDPVIETSDDAPQSQTEETSAEELRVEPPVVEQLEE